MEEYRLCHACEPIPESERVDDAPRASSSSTPASGVPSASSMLAPDALLAVTTPAGDAPPAPTPGSPTQDAATPSLLPRYPVHEEIIPTPYTIPAMIVREGETQGDEEPSEARG
jgi:hypothetical protein